MNKIRMGAAEENRRKDRKILTDPPFYLPEFEEAYHYIIHDHPVENRNIAIFLPCAMKKPYSTSPSHRLFRSIIDEILSPEQYHIIIFGTCGIVPNELEEMYPFTSYKYMLGRCKDERIKQDFVRIETDKIAGYLKKTEHSYRMRLAYCIGLFREAFELGSKKAGINIDSIIPSKQMIVKMYDECCAFPEGSLSMDEYLAEFRDELLKLRDKLE